MNVFDVSLLTRRIRLRRIAINDLYDIFEYTSAPLVTEFLEWEAHKDISQTVNFIRKINSEYNNLNSSFVWGIEYVENSKLIGSVRIYEYVPAYGRAEISYILNPAYQGKGIMTEALLEIYNFCFEKLEFTRLQAKCSVNNKSSIKLLEKTGMNREGRLRKYYKAHGKYQDSFLFAITSDKYFSGIIKN